MLLKLYKFEMKNCFDVCDEGMYNGIVFCYRKCLRFCYVFGREELFRVRSRLFIICLW